MSKCKMCGTANFQNASKCRMCGAHLPVMDEEIDSTTNNEIFSSKNSKGTNPSAERAKEIYSSHSNYTKAQQKKLFEKIRLQEEALGDVSDDDFLTNPEKKVEPSKVNNPPKKPNNQNKNKGKSKPSSSKEHTIPQRVIESNAPASDADVSKKSQGNKGKQNNKNKNNNNQNRQRQSGNNQNRNQNKKSDSSQSQKNTDKLNSDNKQTGSNNRPSKENLPNNGSKKPYNNANQKNNKKSVNSQASRKEKSTQPVQTTDDKTNSTAKAYNSESPKNTNNKKKKNKSNTQQNKKEKNVGNEAVGLESKNSDRNNGQKRTQSQAVQNTAVTIQNEKSTKTGDSTQITQTNTTVKMRTVNPKRVHKNRKPQSESQNNVSADKAKDSNALAKSDATAVPNETVKKELPNDNAFKSKPQENTTEPKKVNVQTVTKVPPQKTVETVSSKSASKKDIRKNKKYAAIGYIGPLILITLIKSSNSVYCKKHLRRCLRTFIFSLTAYLVTLLGMFVLHSALSEESNKLYVILSLLIALVSSVSIFVPTYNGVISALSGIIPQEKQQLILFSKKIP